MTVPPTVVIIDDDEAVRASVAALAGSIGYRTQQFPSAQSFLDEYVPVPAGCLVLDVRMRGMSGLELQSRMGEAGIDLPIIFVTGHGDVPMAVHAMRAGAVDFIEKPYRDQVLLDRIQHAINLHQRQRALAADKASARERLADLTPRESQVLDGIMASKANKEIAADLGISVRAVESHRARLMERTGSQGVSELVQTVMRARDESAVDSEIA